MPRFLTRATTHDVIPDGVYVFKIVQATERVSENGKPPGNDVETELLGEHVRGRYLYAVGVNDVSDPASDPIPKIVRFISREAAILKNPSIADIQLQPQPAVVLPAFRNGGTRP